jgi:hypothetical protein
MSIRSSGFGLRRAALTAFASAGLLLPSAALARAECPTQPTSKAFARFGDQAEYSQIPGGSFEDAGAGWTFISSKVAFGNDGYNVLPGNRSAQLGGGIAAGFATAISPRFCIDASHPYFRFMLRPMSAVGTLTTFIVYRDESGKLVRSLLASNISTTFMPGNWRPSVLNPLSSTIPLLEAGGTATVQLGFTSTVSVNGPSYYIDNVLIDPYRRG